MNLKRYLLIWKDTDAIPCADVTDFASLTSDLLELLGVRGARRARHPAEALAKGLALHGLPRKPMAQRVAVALAYRLAHPASGWRLRYHY